MRETASWLLPSFTPFVPSHEDDIDCEKCSLLTERVAVKRRIEPPNITMVGDTQENQRARAPQLPSVRPEGVVVVVKRKMWPISPR